MPDEDGKDFAPPDPVVYVLHTGERVVIRPLSFGQLMALATLVERFAVLADSTGDINLFRLVKEHPDLVDEGISVALSAPAGWTAGLRADDAINLILLLFEINRPLINILSTVPRREAATADDLARPPLARYDAPSQQSPVSLAFLISLFTGEPESRMPAELSRAVLQPQQQRREPEDEEESHWPPVVGAGMEDES